MKPIYWLALLVIFVNCAFLWKIQYILYPNGPITMKIIKNKVPILSITQAPDIKHTWKKKIPTIDFPKHIESFSHASLGNLGYHTNFFAEFTVGFTVEKKEKYTFEIESDDGFQLYIDEKLIGEFQTFQPFTKHKYTIELDEGFHTYRLYYFQGGGHMGLVASYYSTNNFKPMRMGKNAYGIKFVPWEK